MLCLFVIYLRKPKGEQNHGTERNDEKSSAKSG